MFYFLMFCLAQIQTSSLIHSAILFSFYSDPTTPSSITGSNSTKGLNLPRKGLNSLYPFTFSSSYPSINNFPKCSFFLFWSKNKSSSYTGLDSPDGLNLLGNASEFFPYFFFSFPSTFRKRTPLRGPFLALSFPFFILFLLASKSLPP